VFSILGTVASPLVDSGSQRHTRKALGPRHRESHLKMTYIKEVCDPIQHAEQRLIQQFNIHIKNLAFPIIPLSSLDRTFIVTRWLLHYQSPHPSPTTTTKEEKTLFSWVSFRAARNLSQKPHQTSATPFPRIRVLCSFPNQSFTKEMRLPQLPSARDQQTFSIKSQRANISGLAD
jgi:hypothetical protein